MLYALQLAKEVTQARFESCGERSLMHLKILLLNGSSEACYILTGEAHNK